MKRNGSACFNKQDDCDTLVPSSTSTLCVGFVVVNEYQLIGRLLEIHDRCSYSFSHALYFVLGLIYEKLLWNISTELSWGMIESLLE